MKDRQFMIVLGLVVAAGLVMGLIAFRMTAGGAPAATAAARVKAIGGDPNAPRPSAADGVVDVQPENPPQTADAQSQNGEPSPPAKDPPDIAGPSTGDPPQVAAAPDQSDAPAAAAPPSDSSPQ